MVIMDDKKKKLVPALRFSEFVGEWDKKKVGELCDFIVPGRNKPTSFLGKIPWITTPDIIHNGTVEFSKKELGLSREEAKRIGSKIVPVNAVIISCVGELGLVALAGKEIVINQQLHAFIPKEKINNRFLLYSISRQKRYMLKIATKTAVLYMNKDNCNSIPILFPPLPEQQKIANFLSSVDKKIEQLCQKVSLLEDYKKGVMQQIFSQKIRFKDDNGEAFVDWEVKKLNEILKKSRLGGNYANAITPTSYPLIKMGNLNRGKISLNKVYYIQESEKVEEIDKIRSGDLFFNTRNTLDLVGKVAIWRNELPVAYYNSNLMYLKFENNYFMNYRFNSYDGIKTLRRLATGTTSVAAIYTKDLMKIKLSIPSVKEQQKIANFLSSIDDKIQQSQQQLAQAQQFKKGLLQQLFV